MAPPHPVFAFDTNSLSAVRRMGTVVPVIEALSRRSAWMVVPHHAVNELLQGEGSGPAELIEVLQEISRFAPGVLGFGQSLTQLWQTEVWSALVNYGHFGREVDHWLQRVPAELVEESAVEQRAFQKKLEESLTPDPSRLTEAQLKYRQLKTPLEELLIPEHEMMVWLLQPVLQHLGLANHAQSILRFPPGYPSINVWVRLSALSRQLGLYASDRLSALPEARRSLFPSKPNDEVDAFIAAGAVYANCLVTEDKTLTARLAHLATLGLPVPRTIRLSDFLVDL